MDAQSGGQEYHVEDRWRKSGDGRQRMEWRRTGGGGVFVDSQRWRNEEQVKQGGRVETLTEWRKDGID